MELLNENERAFWEERVRDTTPKRVISGTFLKI